MAKAPPHNKITHKSISIGYSDHAQPLGRPHTPVVPFVLGRLLLLLLLLLMLLLLPLRFNFMPERVI